MTAWVPTLGATLVEGGVRFTVWAPKPRTVSLVLLDELGERDRVIEMEHEGSYWRARVAGIGAGQRYAYLVDGHGPFPDPCSRSQPEGVHMPSEVVDPCFDWGTAAFEPPPPRDLVIYELHVGTFTREGTFESAIRELPRLAALGVNAFEVMPIASFPGRWNWGYDGAALFAPAAVYGGPSGFREFVAAAHREGLAVLLDVVFNHFGPDGNYTGVYSDTYLTDRHHTAWGDAVNFDAPGADGMRQLLIENVLHWRHEYRVDGFRFDATDVLHDDSPVHILAEVRRELDSHPAGPSPAILIAETSENDPRYVRPLQQGGFGFDAVWADDFHHAVRTTLRPERQGYLACYEGSVEEIARTVAQGFLFEGQQTDGSRPSGKPARDRPWSNFVYCIQNHDQVGNRAFGDRLAATVGRDRQLALTVLLLTLPQVPLLFQGQEWASTTPFQFFTDHTPELGLAVTHGRREEFAAFTAFRDERLRELIPDPQDERTFRRSQLDSSEEGLGLGALAADFHRELLWLRRTDPVLRASRHGRAPLAAKGEGDVVVVDLQNPAGRRLVAVNLGPGERRVEIAPGGSVVVASTEAHWGGPGTPVRIDGEWLTLPRDCGVLVRVEASPSRTR